MSMQLQPPVLPVSLMKTELVTAIKNEPPEVDIDEYLDSPEKVIISDIKNVNIVSHVIYEDSIKSETNPHILESKYSESVETQVIVKTENAPLIKIENITHSEILIKTEEDPSDSNLDKKTDFAGCYRSCGTTSWEEDKAKIKVIKPPVIPVEPHEYTSFAKDKHVCNHCQYTSNILEYVKRHIKTMHREVTRMFQCPYCPFKSKWRSSLRFHVILKHKDTKDIQWFKCDICDMKFKLKYRMIEHIKVHFTHEQMRDKLKLCPVCGKGFKTGTYVRKHMRFVHDKEERNQVERKCQECEYTTTKFQLLKQHIKSTHKIHEKRYHCDMCDYKSYKPQPLKRHKLIHSKPEEIQYLYCYHCPYKSKRKENLKSHIVRHFKNEEIEFHCHICDSMTLNRELIIDHIKKHSKNQIRN